MQHIKRFIKGNAVTYGMFRLVLHLIGFIRNIVPKTRFIWTRRIVPIIRLMKIRMQWHFIRKSTTTGSGSALDREIIVSLTSYPARIHRVYETIESILIGTLKPDRIILWLADTEFPDKEGELPGKLLALKRNGLQINWCENLKSLKNMVPCLSKYGDNFVVTADDDIYYDKDWLKTLVTAYRKKPDVIWCSWVERIRFNEGVINGEAICFEKNKTFPVPSYLHKIMPGAGALFPPHVLFDELYDDMSFLERYTTNDDIWIWAMCVLCGHKIGMVSGGGRPVIAEWEINSERISRTNNMDNKAKMRGAFDNIVETYPRIKMLLKEEMDAMQGYDA